MKFLDDKGIGEFLTNFYELVFDLARLIPYDNSNQEKLVQLILELRKLPPKQFKIWKVCKVFYALSPVLLLILRLLLGGLPRLDSGTIVWGLTEDNWNGSYRKSEGVLVSFVSFAIITDESPKI